MTRSRQPNRTAPAASLPLTRGILNTHLENKGLSETRSVTADSEQNCLFLAILHGLNNWNPPQGVIEDKQSGEKKHFHHLRE